MSASARAVFVWRKLASSKWEDAWNERLTGFADRLAVTQPANARMLRLEIFQLKKAEAERLRRAFGGTVAVQKKLTPAAHAKPRAPIVVRGKLAIVTSERERRAVAARMPALLIPAGMAFGTGEHATTSTCLRLLADVAGEFRGQKWEMLDLGCGSGILAMAARMLGAKRAEAADFDPHAVRTAKENAAANGLTRIIVKRADVREWEPAQTWAVVAANLFSGLLIEVSTKIAASVAGNGWLILSGILRTQEAEVVAAYRRAGFRVERTVRKGKWIALLARRR